VSKQTSAAAIAQIAIEPNLTAAATLTGTEVSRVYQGSGIVRTTTAAVAKIPVETSLSAAGALSGSEKIRMYQGSGIVVATPAQIAAYASPFVVPTTQTSAYVIANNPISSSAGKQFKTTDMGVMMCDGVRWFTVGSPPVPPGAQMFGFSRPLFVCFPNVGDLGNYPNGTNNTNGAYSLYNGYAPYSNSNHGTFGTDANGRFTMQYLGSGLNNAFAIQNPYATDKAYNCYGRLPYWQAGKGFYAEFAAVMAAGTAGTDCWNAGFLFPMEHNNEQDDSNTSIGTKWEQWHEWDINESGQGTNYSGAYRGAYLQHMGWYNWSNTFVSAPSGTITTFPNLTSNWAGETMALNMTLGGSGQQIVGNFTAGSKVVTCSSTLITGTPTTSFTTKYGNPINSSAYNTTFIDITQEHTYGVAYDPVSQTSNYFTDGAFIGSISTFNANSANTFRDSLRMEWLFFCQSHGTPFTPSTMAIRYFATWVP
jgi:hypothetical protein